MPTLTLTGPNGQTKKVTLSDNFNSLSPQEQQNTIHQIAGQVFPSSAAPAPAPKPGILPSIAASAGAGFGEAALGAQQLLGKVLEAPTLQAPPSLSTLISGQPPGQATTGVAGFLNKISDIQNIPANWLEQNAAAGLAKLQQQQAPYQAAHPFAAGAGEFGGQAVASFAPEGLLAKLPKAAELLSPAETWLGRAGQAARTGLVSGAEQPISGPDYWKQKAKETAANVAGSLVGGQIAEVPRTAAHILSKYSPAAVGHHALKSVISAIDQGIESGHIKAQDIIDFFNTTRAAGVPTTLMEAGGHPVQTLAGVAARTPGKPSAIIRGSFEERTGEEKSTGEKKVRSRLLAAIKRNFDAPETRREAQEALRESQFAASRPLYQKLFQPSSIVSISKQFKEPFAQITKTIKAAEKEWKVAEKRFQDAAKKVSSGKTHVYLNSDELQAMEGAKADAEASAKKLSDLRKQKESILSQLRATQQAEARGIRGAVHSPHISYMMQDPLIQEGIKTGMATQATEAKARFLPFDPNDYGVRYNKQEEPEIFATPNMRLLDAAKRGLDEMLNKYRNPVTGKLELHSDRARSIDELRRAWIKELDRVNPAYKEARDAYAGPAALINAMDLGEKIMDMHPEDVKKYFEEMSESEKEHFRMGAAQAYSDKVGDLAITDKELRQISEKDELAEARRRLKPIFKTKAQLDDFMASVTGERAIYNAEKKITGGSQSQERARADAAISGQNVLDAAQAALHAKSGNAPGAIRKIGSILSRLDPARSNAVQAEIARIVSDPNIQLSNVPGEVLSMTEAPPPGLFTSAAMGLGPIGQAIGAQTANRLGTAIFGQ